MVNESDIDIENIVNELPIVSRMMERNQIYGILYNLKYILDLGIEGDIVELGCNIGTTSIFIRRLLDIYNSKKVFHVYDSWEGLPDKQKEDETNGFSSPFIKGSCKCDRDIFELNFKSLNLKVPLIHSGNFKNSSYPKKICFAFLDGDFYSSITDSLNCIFDSVVCNGIIIIDDVGGVDINKHRLPGAEKALIDFLKDKKENYTYDAYPNENLLYDNKNYDGAKIIKLV